MRVAVIGGSHLVGPPTVRGLLEAGHEVSVYNRGHTPVQLPAGVEHVKVDRKVPGQLTAVLRDRAPEAVVDMIAYVLKDVEEVFAGAPSLRHYVFCGTVAVYGRIGRTTPGESDALAPYDAYTENKIACEQFLEARFKEDGFAATNLRLAHPYGPRDHLIYTTGRESVFVDRMRKGRPIIITGNGASRIHAIFSEDVGRAFVHVLGQAEHVGKTFNLAGEEILSYDEYFASIARALGVPLVARKVPQAFFKDNAHLWADRPRKFDFGGIWPDYESAFDISALRDTGFRSLTDHDTGVSHAVEWLDANDKIGASTDEDEEDIILRNL